MNPFGPFLPDLDDYGNPGVTLAKNLLPSTQSYEPFSLPRKESNTALPSRCMGAYASKDQGGQSYNYVGTNTKLWLLDASFSWLDVTRASGDYSAQTQLWSMTKWGESVVATNYFDIPQLISFGGTNFDDLTQDVLVRGRYVMRLRDNLVFGHTFDATDGEQSTRIWWSAIDDISTWSPNNTAGFPSFQDLRGDGGAIQAMIGGEYGVILQERAVTRMSFRGPGIGYQFDETLKTVGTRSPRSAIKIENRIFMLANDGFRVITNGTASEGIGEGKVDQFFFDLVDTNYLDRVSAINAVQSMHVGWSFPGPGNTNGTPNMALLYNYFSGKWTFIEDPSFLFDEFFWSAPPGITLDTLDAPEDTVTLSLDDPFWSGGPFQTGAIGADGNLYYFSGDPMPATIETAELSNEEGSAARTLIKGVKPFISEAGDITVQLGVRDSLSDPVQWQPALIRGIDDWYSTLVSGRYFRARFNITGGMKHALGYEYKAQGAGLT